MTTPTITLVIPAYNEAEYIRACLECVTRNGAGRLLEIIVVDNASTDDTSSIAAGFAGVRLVKEEQKGLARARQRGFLEARGEVIAYIDADTRMPVGWFERLTAGFENDSKVVLVSGPYRYYDISRLRNFFVAVWYWCAYPMYLVTGYMATGGNFAIRKSTLEQMNGFDTSIEFYGEDTNIARRAHQFGKVLFDPRLVMPTSGRRLKGQGFLKTAALYGANFFSEVILRRPVGKKYTDIR